MTTLHLRKLYNSLVPADELTVEEMEKIKPNAIVKAEVKQPRNIGFHRKFFALLDVAFNAWDAPELEYKDVSVQKNRERFRKDIIIQCGFYDLSVGIDGRVRCDAKSISFAKMDEIEFEELYSTAIDVILQKVLSGYTREDLDFQVNKILRFG